MKWQQRVRVATGLSCWQIMLHLLVVAVLVMGWMSGTLVRVGLGLCVLYGVTGLSLVGFGLLISALCSTQQQAFIGVFVFMMPAILLSGYVSPVENMPVWLQDLTWVNPIRHFTDITKQIYLKDASLDIVWGSLWPLLVIAATTGSVAYAMFRRNIA
ncbi:MAG: YbhQ family protein [Enterobacter asburiae]|nr:YbhQ family protein [Enterobacter asburiae]